ncbi:hypothetical protein [Pseudorhodoferax sp. Leaf265]|jgi:hypothetical protein|uniref:hypothetical protein n=1 Tax=Pseudorhodoferax sp. Leaf265 TaxID=1736315 RepID=UPI0007C8143E|nr:hypothetical protein [Pseudorhodoferax sp. Leaf265]
MSRFASQKLSSDAIGRDAAQMAAHMLQCKAARGDWFGLAGALQRVSVATAGRLVTVACLGALLLAALAAFR